MTGLDALCAGLADLGVRHVFGLPGTQNADFFSALPDHGLRPVLATHELSASFMANGYARASGRVGVLATIPGPGFTFALPGLAEARLDSVPLLHLVGTPAKGSKRFLHQAIDQAGIARPLVKAVVELDGAAGIQARLREAHRLALAGEPGPVLLHLDPALLNAEATADAGASTGGNGAAGAAAAAAAEWIAPLRRLLAASERPVLFVGGGALAHAEAVQRLAERLAAPTFTTLTARGILAEDHPCAMAFDSDRGGITELNALVERSDLVLALGCKFSHNGTTGFRIQLPPDRLVHVNADREALGTSYPARLEIEADVGDVLAALLDDATPEVRPRWSPQELTGLKAGIARIQAPRVPEPRFAGISGHDAPAFFQALRRALPRDAIVVTDSGLHQVMTRRYYEVLGARGLIAPSDFQSMGFGIPAALGAALAEPSRPVVAIVGDGGFLMSAMDLACAAREGIPAVVVVFNDGHLNLIRVKQLQERGRGSAVDIATPDLEAFAGAISVRYGLLEGDVEATLRDACSSEGPTLLEVRLGDSLGMQALRAGGLARQAARRTVGDTVLGRALKRLRRMVQGR